MSVGVIEEGQYNKCADKGKCLRRLIQNTSHVTHPFIVNEWKQITWDTNHYEDVEIKADGFYIIRQHILRDMGNYNILDTCGAIIIVTGDKEIYTSQMDAANYNDQQDMTIVLFLKAGQKVRFMMRAAQSAGGGNAWCYMLLTRWFYGTKEVTA